MDSLKAPSSKILAMRRQSALKQFDLMSLAGIVLVVLGLCCEVFARVFNGLQSFVAGLFDLIHLGPVMHFVNVPAFFLILFASFGATIIAHQWEEIKTLPRLLSFVIKESDFDFEKIIVMLASFSEKARREGLLKLEDELKGIADPFIKEAVQLVIDGTDMELLQRMLTIKLEAMKERHKKGEMIFMDWGGFAPTIGIIGTVMGLIHVLSSGLGSGNMSALGAGIARAFLATFYGIASANLLLLPAAGKLRLRNQDETMMKEMILEGIMSIQSGDNPRLLKEKLKTFLPSKTEAKPKIQKVKKTGLFKGQSGGPKKVDKTEEEKVGVP
ncbi:MAG: MotA/TolQ/ExbB proton channel family protein [Firmicutes bacterium]|nr:MotA/TolQ/ExbB proton channel family protein [Bacillota bacterium]